MVKDAVIDAPIGGRQAIGLRLPGVTFSRITGYADAANRPDCPTRLAAKSAASATMTW